MRTQSQNSINWTSQAHEYSDYYEVIGLCFASDWLRGRRYSHQSQGELKQNHCFHARLSTFTCTLHCTWKFYPNKNLNIFVKAEQETVQIKLKGLSFYKRKTVVCCVMGGGGGKGEEVYYKILQLINGVDNVNITP